MAASYAISNPHNFLLTQPCSHLSKLQDNRILFRVPFPKLQDGKALF